VHNREGIIIMTTMSILILLVTVPTALGFNLGVKSGDWIEYDYQENSEITTEQNQKVEFINVAGTELTLRVTEIMPSGAQFPQTEDIDLTTGEDFSTLSFVSARTIIIPNGTSIGGSVYLGNQFGNRTILGEATMACAGADRRVIFANFSLQQSQYTMYWDKQTGVLVEATMSAGVMYKTLSIVDTNMWTGGLGWWLWVIIAIVIAAGIMSTKRKAIGNLLRRSNARRNGEAPAK
jgi:hypothetical protein